MLHLKARVCCARKANMHRRASIDHSGVSSRNRGLTGNFGTERILWWPVIMWTTNGGAFYH